MYTRTKHIFKIPENLYQAYGFALAKSLKATTPHDAIWRALRIVGGIEGAPDAVRNVYSTDVAHFYREQRKGESYQALGIRAATVADWLTQDSNQAKVEAIALALIDGTLNQRSKPSEIRAILRKAEGLEDAVA